MKRSIISLLQFAVLVFSASARAESEKLQFPFAWSVEKDGKTHHILGTIHVGVSLEKDVPCSDKIIKQIESSDLVFLESETLSAQLSRKDMIAFYTGSKEEREEVMSRFSPEVRQKIIERKKESDKKTIGRDLFPFRFVYEGHEGFKDLNEKTKEFLVSHGADIQGNYTDYLYFIYEILYNDAMFSIGEAIDLQVAGIALSNGIEMKALDDSSQVTQDLVSEIGDSEKPIQPFSRVYMESLIEYYDQPLEQMKQSFLHLSQLYISGDVEAFKSAKINYEETFLKKRNELWLRKFREAHESSEYESLFLAGGTRHFVGSFNLIDQLKEEGFSVHTITCPADIVQN